MLFKSSLNAAAAVLVLSSTSLAIADDAFDARERVGSVKVEEITGLENAFNARTDGVRNPRVNWRPKNQNRTMLYSDTDPVAGGIGDILDETDVILDKVITIGEKIWKIVEKNRPVVDTSFKPGLAMLPEGASGWTQLAGWQIPETRVYRVTYKNLYQMTVVNFTFAVAYTYGGSVQGKGKYLANVEVEPLALDVAWSYQFSATSEVVNPHNGGTHEDPMAASEVRVNWSVKNVLKTSHRGKRFFIRGDGLFKNLTSGTLPAL